MKKKWLIALPVLMLAGCATPIQTGPEFRQKVILQVGDEYQVFQAQHSGYDLGDLQSFHSQHAFPMMVEEAFKELFDEVEVQKIGEARLETEEPEVPAVFEVRMLDLAHDTYQEADSYRSQCVVAVAMKSPGGHTFWQQAFRGEGYVQVDPQFSTGLGPQDAVVFAVQDAIEQMQKAMVKSPEVVNQLRHYSAIQQSRKATETQL